MDLHANLTLVQSKLLDILHGQLDEAEQRAMHQQFMQREWSEFTVSLEKSLDLISVNVTHFVRDLFTALLRLQTFTRVTARRVAEELQNMEADVHNVRGELGRVHDDIDNLGSHGMLKIVEFNEFTQRQLYMVLIPCHQLK